MRAARRLGPALAAAALLPALISLLVPATGETAYNAGRQGMPGVAPLSDAAKLSEAANAAADAARREAGEALPPPTMEELRQLDRMRYGEARARARPPARRTPLDAACSAACLRLSVERSADALTAALPPRAQVS